MHDELLLRGAYRKDGMITPHTLPTREELEGRLGLRELLYVRTPDGEYVPVWRTEL